MWYGPCHWLTCHMPRRHSVLRANEFPSSCLLQSGIGSKAKKRWLCHFRDSKDLKPSTVIKEFSLLLVFSCGTSGGMSESRFLKRLLKRTWLCCGLFSYKVASNGVERKSPVPIMWMASVPPHSSLPCVLSFSCQWRGEVQHWGCIQGRSLGKLVKGSEPCDWWTRLLNHIRRTGHGTGGLQSDCTKLAIKDFCTAEDPIWL